MNSASVLMCWDVPNIDEELLFELFCIAGPIEMIQFSNSHRSCFIVYEHPDAVATAKEIFRGVRIMNRLIHFFDQRDINEIHAQQEVALIAKEENRRNTYHSSTSGNSSNLMQDPHAFAMNYNYSSPIQTFIPDYNQSQALNTHIRFRDDSSSLNDNMNMYGSPSKYAEMRSDLMPSTRSSRHNNKLFSHQSSEEFEKASNDVFLSMKNPYSSSVPRNRHSEDDLLPPGVSNDEFKHDRNSNYGPNYRSLPERFSKYNKLDHRDQDNTMRGLAREDKRDNRWRKHDNRDYNSRDSGKRHYNPRNDNYRNYSRNNDYVARNRYNNQRDRKYPEYRNKGRY